MPTVHFKLKDVNSSKPTIIYLIFSFGYTKINPETNKKVYLPLKYSTKLKIHSDYWNPDTARVNENSEFKEAREYNLRLDEIEFNIKDIYRKLVDKDMQVLPWVLSRELNLRLGRKSKKRSLTFFDFSDKFIEHAKLKKSPATISKYRKTIQHIENYVEHSSKVIDFDSFNLNFYKDFNTYMRDELHFTQNTIAKYIATLKLILNEASIKGVNKNLIFKHKNFKIKTEKSLSFFLNQEELNKISQFKTDNPKINTVKNIFLILSYTGLAYSELIQLNDTSFVVSEGRKYIKVKKNNRVRIVPLHWEVEKILSANKGLLEKLLSQQRLNEYLKNLASLVFMEDIENGQSKYLQLCTETAKRSFLILLYNNVVNLETILYYSGYKQTPSFLMRYIERSKNENELFIHHSFFERK